MFNQKKLSSFLLLLVIPTLGLIACSKPEKAEVITTESSASSVPSETVKLESTEHLISPRFQFQILHSVSFHISLPNGYQFHEATSVNFEKIPFWTGQHIENVEGQLYSAPIQQMKIIKKEVF